MHHLPAPRRPRRAFSLIELAVVLIVVAVITAIAIPTFQATITASDESTAGTEVATGLRNAVAIARARGELGAPSPQVVAEAFAEMSAHAPGVSAVTVGAWTVCDVDAVGYNDCVDNATGTLIRYQVAGGVVGIVVDSTYTVLARASGTQVASWVDADGTTTDALDGPGGPSVPSVPVSGTVAQNFTDAGYDYTACFAELWTPSPAASSSTLLASTPVGADGSFTLISTAGQDVNVRIDCPGTGPGGQSQAWWYTSGTDTDQTPATEVALVDGGPVDLGTVDVRTGA